MKTLTTLQEIIAEANGKKMYMRWSRGPSKDKKQGVSIDYSNYQRHNGLSAQSVSDDPELLAQMLPEYKFLRRKDPKIYCWIFTGNENGADSDGAPTVDADSINPIAKISDELINKCDEFNWAYRNYRQKYAYNPNASQKALNRNLALQASLDDAWQKVITE